MPLKEEDQSVGAGLVVALWGHRFIMRALRGQGDHKAICSN